MFRSQDLVILVLTGTIDKADCFAPCACVWGNTHLFVLHPHQHSLSHALCLTMAEARGHTPLPIM